MAPRVAKDAGSKGVSGVAGHLGWRPSLLGWRYIPKTSRADLRRAGALLQVHSFSSLTYDGVGVNSPTSCDARLSTSVGSKGSLFVTRL